MKKIISVLFLSLTVLSLTGCNNHETTSDNVVLTIDDLRKASSIDNPIEISLWHTMNNLNQRELSSIIDNFENIMRGQDVYIHINDSYIGDEEDINYSLKIGLAPNNVPTILLDCSNNLFDYINYSDSEILLPLDPYINADDEDIALNKSDFIDTYWSDVTLKNYNGDDIVAGIPFTRSTQVMYYNASVVDPILKELNYGEEVDGEWVWSNPTWDQVATVSQYIIDKINNGGISWKYGFNDYSVTEDVIPTMINSDNFFMTTAKQWCSSEEDASVVYNNEKGQVTFRNETALEAQEYFLEKAIKGLWRIDRDIYFYRNSSFIYIDSTNNTTNYGTNYELKCTIYPQKSYDDNSVKLAICAGTNAAILTPNSDNIERLAAWLLIKYMTNTENNVELSTKKFTLPTLNSSLESKEYKNFLTNPFNKKEAQSLIASNKQIEFMYNEPVFLHSILVSDVVDEMVERIYDGYNTIVDAMNAAYKILEEEGVETI